MWFLTRNNIFNIYLPLAITRIPFFSLSCSLSLIAAFRSVSLHTKRVRNDMLCAWVLLKCEIAWNHEHYMPARNWIILCDYTYVGLNSTQRKLKYIAFVRRVFTYHETEPSSSELNHCAVLLVRTSAVPSQQSLCNNYFSDFNKGCAPNEVPLARELLKSSQSYWMLNAYNVFMIGKMLNQAHERPALYRRHWFNWLPVFLRHCWVWMMHFLQLTYHRWQMAC